MAREQDQKCKNNQFLMHLFLHLTLLKVFRLYIDYIPYDSLKNMYPTKYFNFFVSAGTKIKCFECNSHDDPKCLDPFNWTTIPDRKLCEGCCVKIVQGINTGEQPLISCKFCAKKRQICTYLLKRIHYLITGLDTFFLSKYFIK